MLACCFYVVLAGVLSIRVLQSFLLTITQASLVWEGCTLPAMLIMWWHTHLTRCKLARTTSSCRGAVTSACGTCEVCAMRSGTHSSGMAPASPGARRTRSQRVQFFFGRPLFFPGPSQLGFGGTHV